MRFIFNLIKNIFSGIIYAVNWVFDNSSRAGKTRVSQDKYLDKINTSRMKRDGRYYSR